MDAYWGGDYDDDIPYDDDDVVMEEPVVVPRSSVRATPPMQRVLPPQHQSQQQQPQQRKGSTMVAGVSVPDGQTLCDVLQGNPAKYPWMDYVLRGLYTYALT